jgi:hypothetical protein
MMAGRRDTAGKQIEGNRRVSTRRAGTPAIRTVFQLVKEPLAPKAESSDRASMRWL